MKYEQICYSWLHGGDYKGAAPDGWGVAATSSRDPAFLKCAVDLMTNRKASLSGEVTEYYEYSEGFRRFIYLGVRSLPVLPQMGGGDNNRLMHLYVPAEEETCVSGPGYTDYLREVPPPEQRGMVGQAEFYEKSCDYQDLLQKYGLHQEQGEAAVHRFAVLLSLLYLSFYSDEWKQLVFPVKDRNPYETAREVTWLLHSLVPAEVFGKTGKELLRRLRYVVTDEIQGYHLTFISGKHESLSLRQHRYGFNEDYDARTVISREGMDRKVDKTAEFFLALAVAAQKSPQEACTMIAEILHVAKEKVDDIQGLNRAYQSDYIPYKQYDGMSREIYLCSTLEGLLQMSEDYREELQEGISRFCNCNTGTAAAVYLTGGDELLKLLSDADVDEQTGTRILEQYEVTGRFSKYADEPSVEEKAAIHLILERLKEALLSAVPDMEAKTETVSGLSGEPDTEVETETASGLSDDGAEEKKEGEIKDHSDTQARMDALSCNKKNRSFLLSFFRKKS